MLKTTIFAFLALTISSLQLQMINNNTAVNFIHSLITTEEKQLVKDGDEDQCLDLLETILEEAQQIAKDADAQKWNEILPNLLELMKNAIDDYNCFKNSDIQMSERLLSVTKRNFKDEHLQCVIDHLKLVADDFRDAMMALTKKEAAKFIELVAKLVEDFKDIRNC